MRSRGIGEWSGAGPKPPAAVVLVVLLIAVVLAGCGGGEVRGRTERHGRPGTALGRQPVAWKEEEESAK
jgi:hypothetical protein